MIKIKPNAPNRLIVEGKDDAHSIIHLTARHELNWSHPTPGLPYVHDAGGIADLLEALPSTVKTYERLGIVVDADENVWSRWQAIRNHFGRLDIVLPAKPDLAGTIVYIRLPNRAAPKLRCVGVWLMPDNNTSGKLEDFLATLVPVDDPCWQYATEVATHAKKLGAPVSAPDMIKARIHTWLAWQPEPGRPLGTAITSRYFNHDSSEALQFIVWFRKVFLEEIPPVITPA